MCVNLVVFAHVQKHSVSSVSIKKKTNSAPPNDDARKDDEISDKEADTEITDMDTTVIMDQKENKNQENTGTEGWVDVRRKMQKRANPGSNVEIEETSAKKKKSDSGKGEPNSKP